MKRILVLTLLFFLGHNNTDGQESHIGIGGGYKSVQAGNFDFLYIYNQHRFILGITLSPSDTRGKVVSAQKSNYGRTTDGTGNYFTTVDIGYGQNIFKGLSLEGELSIGAKKYYTNYIDRRFTGDGYHMISRSEPIFGIGGKLDYKLSDHLSSYIGYNSFTKVLIGIRFLL